MRELAPALQPWLGSNPWRGSVDLAVRSRSGPPSPSPLGDWRRDQDLPPLGGRGRGEGGQRPRGGGGGVRDLAAPQGSLSLTYREREPCSHNANSQLLPLSNLDDLPAILNSLLLFIDSLVRVERADLLLKGPESR